jgi:hypothetical protein
MWRSRERGAMSTAARSQDMMGQIDTMSVCVE